MIAYIPKQLYENSQNENAVHTIIGKYFQSDVLTALQESEFEECREELKRIGESRIADSLAQLLILN